MNVIRDIYTRLLQWKESPNRQPLILQGACQTGKSYAITEFGRIHYDHVATFNFDRHNELSSIFKETKDVSRIIRELAFFSDVPLIPGKTLIFY